MDPLDGIAVFMTVVRCGSFSAAAEELGCSKSTVSVGVTRLERRIGARLRDGASHNRQSGYRCPCARSDDNALDATLNRRQRLCQQHSQEKSNH